MSELKVWADWEYQPKADPAELGVGQQQIDEAMAAAKADSEGDYSRFGYRLWLNLMREQAFAVSVDRLVDRLPRSAFGETASMPFTMIMLDWSRYRAPDEYQAILAFKTKAIASGWRPAQTNNYFLHLRRMEQAVMGPWKPGEFDPMPAAQIPEGLDARQQRVFRDMKEARAHA